jgi:chemotaxis protein methyltransferase CheR
MINISNEEFNKLAKYIKDFSGIHLKPEKKTLLMGRLNSMLIELKLDNFTEFYNYLQKDKNGEILSDLINKITTNHTYFMREKEHFTFLERTVLPYMKSTIRDKDFRIWCAASSTGEEPYTLAMILEDYFGKDIPKWDKKLLATDISLEVLESARKGVYTRDRLNGIPSLWTLNYFNKNGNEYKIKETIKNQVIYRRFNLLEPVFPFRKKFHVIFCRNVMIYFDQDTKATLVNKFYDHLEDGGYLFIGHSESIDRSRSRFKYIQPAVYRKA